MTPLAQWISVPSTWAFTHAVAACTALVLRAAAVLITANIEAPELDRALALRRFSGVSREWGAGVAVAAVAVGVFGQVLLVVAVPLRRLKPSRAQMFQPASRTRAVGVGQS